MADMLKFRKGTLAQINGTAPVAGTVYIAKDEKAMYVDIASGEGGRIRIGDLIRVASIDKIEPPFSTTSLYYVENENALLGYDGKDWKQINGTEELVTKIAAVEGQAATNKANIATNTADISTLKTDVSGLKTTVGGEDSGLVKDVADLKKAVGMGEDGSFEGVGATVVQLGKDLDALESTVATQGNTISEHTGKISALEQASAQHVTKTEAEAFAKTADIQGTLDKVDTEGTVTAAINAAVAGEKSRAEGAEQTLTNNLAAVKATADNAVSETNFAKFKSDNTTAINDAKTSAVSEATAAAKSYTDGEITKEVTRANGAYAPKSLVETVAGLSGAIGGAESGIVKDIADNKAAVEKAQTDATQALADAKKANDAIGTAEKGLIKDIADAKAAAATADGKAVAAQGAANAAQGAADAAQSAADAAQEDATEALTAIGDANSGLTKAVNANTAAIEILNGADSVNGSVANAKKAGTDAQATANANSGLISGHESRIAAIEADYLVQKDLDDAKAELSAEIDADIRSANAMTFEGIINSQSDFDKITEAQVGDTYVIGTAFGNYQAGDFLIAKGEENEVTGNIIDIQWNHVKSGYDASLDQKLTGTDNKIKLSTGTGLAGTEVAFTATGSASVAVADNTVTIGMVWEDFE